MESLLKMENVSKSFGHIHALQDVDLVLEQGEVLGLVGDNGAGKSTLMKILSGVYTPDAGKIYIHGEEARFTNPLDSRKLGIEMIYQDYALAPDLSASANIFLGKELHLDLLGGLLKWLKNSEMEQSAKRALERLDIRIDSVESKVVALSGGEQQAVAIARAMTFDPGILIMDEPTANLSIDKIGRLLQLVRRLRDQIGVSIILISHRLEDVFSVSNRIMVLKSGRCAGVRKIKEVSLEEVISMMAGTLSDFDNLSQDRYPDQLDTVSPNG